jgi:hypothetical protein
MSDYALPGCILLAVVIVLVVAGSLRKRYPRLLPKLLGIAMAVVMIAFAVPAGFAAFDKLGLLAMACGDGAIGDALLYVGVGYLLSLAGLVFALVYSLLAGRSRQIVKALAIGASLVAFVSILALMTVLGRQWLGGVLPMALYGFAMLQLGYWITRLADSLAGLAIRACLSDSSGRSEPT